MSSKWKGKGTGTGTGKKNWNNNNNKKNWNKPKIEKKTISEWYSEDSAQSSDSDSENEVIDKKKVILKKTKTGQEIAK